MKIRTLAAALCGIGAASIAANSTAGPEKIKYPSDYLKGTLYQTVDRADVKQYRELYAPAAVLEAVRKGRPIPHGAVLTIVVWSVQQDDKGNPIKDTSGRFIKKDIAFHGVMEKRSGWGAEYGPEMRNGEWEYAAFTVDGEPHAKANAGIKDCFTCHLPHAKQDFVISLAKLQGKFPGAEAVKKASRSEVNIVNFVFAPAKFTGTAGKPITFLNSDDSPHQITVTGGPRTGVLLRGQTASITIDKAGGYNYICGLHPSMKGTIEVK